MRIVNKRWGIQAGAGLFFLLTFSACFQPEEGCLDREASNFNITADRACGDCCIYPDISLAVIHRMVLDDTTLTFALNEAYEDDFGQTYRISQLSYFFQAPSWTLQGGEQLRVQDSILLSQVEGTNDTIEDFFLDDMIRVEGSDFQLQALGSFRGSGNLVRFQVSLGLFPDYVPILPSSAPTGHPLSQDDIWTEEEGFAQCRMTLVSESGDEPVTKIIEIRSPQPLGDNLITIDSPVALSPGFSTNVTIQADYRSWLRGVDTATDSESDIAAKIIANLSSSFSLVSIVTEL